MCAKLLVCKHHTNKFAHTYNIHRVKHGTAYASSDDTSCGRCNADISRLVDCNTTCHTEQSRSAAFQSLVANAEVQYWQVRPNKQGKPPQILNERRGNIISRFERLVTGAIKQDRQLDWAIAEENRMELIKWQAGGRYPSWRPGAAGGSPSSSSSSSSI